MSARFEPLALLLLRAEGVASSYIEGLRTPFVDVAAAEVGDTSNPTAGWVADNLAAVRQALGGAGRHLAVEDIHEWHRRLMGPTGHLPDEMVGAFRTAQSWIGGTTPRDASFVPPPPGRVEDLMADLVAFVNAEWVDPVTQAAVAHAQFETIHPYGDGNGRIGRILIGWILAHRIGITVPPPVSVFIARDPGGYLAGLTRFRLGELDPWVDWLAAELLFRPCRGTGRRVGTRREGRPHNAGRPGHTRALRRRTGWPGPTAQILDGTRRHHVDHGLDGELILSATNTLQEPALQGLVRASPGRTLA